MSAYKVNLPEAITEGKLNYLAAEYASVQEVYLSADGDSECNSNVSENQNNLLT